MVGKNDNTLTYVVVIGIIILLLFWFLFCRGDPVNPPEPTPTPTLDLPSNHILNGGFEDYITYWFVEGPYSWMFASGASDSHSGSWALRVDSPYMLMPRVLSQDLAEPIKGCDVQSFSCYVKADIPNNVFTFIFKVTVFYDDGSKTDFVKNYTSHMSDYVKVFFSLSSLSMSKDIVKVSVTVDTVGSYNPNVNYAAFFFDDMELTG